MRLLLFTFLSCLPCTFPIETWIDCHPDSGSNEANCKSRGCVWSPKTVSGAPWCQFAYSDDPSKMVGYDASGRVDQSGNEFTAKLTRRQSPSLFGNDYKKATVKVEQVTEEIVRVLVTDQNNQARPALYPKWRKNLRTYGHGRKVEESPLEVKTEDSPFGLAVIRKSTNVTLIDSRRLPGFTLAKQYLQFSIRVPTQFVYGLGETTHQQLKHDFNYKKWGFMSRDYPPGFDETNLYGVHSFYLCIDDDTGTSHGVFLLNTHALNVALQPDPSNSKGGIITWRAIGGALELFIFSGPTPDSVLRQYTSIIGRPQIPPYWALGFQLSRFGLKNLTMLEDVFERNRRAKIPQDVQTIDDDYMNDQMDFTYDNATYSNLTGFIQKLHDQYNMKLVLIIDPAIASKPPTAYPPLEQGLRMGIFIKDNRTGKPFEGKVWPGTTYFPDFTHPNATAWWTAQIQEFYTKQGIKFDGLWLDMNEPSNFYDGSVDGCSNNSYNNPPYNPLKYKNMFEKTVCMDADQHLGKHYELHNLYGYLETKATYKALQPFFTNVHADVSVDRCSNNSYNNPPYNPLKYKNMFEKTVCMDADQHLGKHYELHNLYGYLETKATYKALQTVFPEQRPFTYSRSTFAGSGKYTNHWTGDNTSQWPHLKMSIITMLEFNLFGIPFVGADICGFRLEANEELCVRWHQTGAFYPFSRNHNDKENKVDQDPAAWSTAAQGSIRGALQYRYAFLPYLYGLLYQAHLTGSAVARPMFYDYPDDPQCRIIDDQFTWGPSLLVAPVLEQGATGRTVYFPRGRWFDAVYFSEVPNASTGRSLHVDIPLYPGPIGPGAPRLFIRGGTALPYQLPAETTALARRNALWLLVGLDEMNQADGALYWDDGQSDNVNFSMVSFNAWQQNKNAGIHIKPLKNEYKLEPKLDRIVVYGLSGGPVNGSVSLDGHPIAKYEYVEGKRVLLMDSLGIDANSAHEITWNLK